MVQLRMTIGGAAARTSGKSVSFAVAPEPKSAAGTSAWAKGPPMGSMSRDGSKNPNAPAAKPNLKAGANQTISAVNQVGGLMQGMAIGTQGSKAVTIQDPSIAPLASVAPSMMTTFKPYTESRFSTPRADDRSGRRKWISNNVCKKSPWVRKTFQKGDVIALTHHTPNMNEHCDLNDKGLTINSNFGGGIFTKRRMMVVLFKHTEFMVCLPLYSFSGRGILSRRPQVLHEYAQLMDQAHSEGFPIHGEYDPIEFKHKDMNRSLLPETVIHLAGAISVNWEEDIAKVGRLTQEGYEALLGLWTQLNDAAIEEDADWTN